MWNQFHEGRRSSGKFRKPVHATYYNKTMFTVLKIIKYKYID